jgi:hypothetical protein
MQANLCFPKLLFSLILAQFYILGFFLYFFFSFFAAYRKGSVGQPIAAAKKQA